VLRHCARSAGVTHASQGTDAAGVEVDVPVNAPRNSGATYAGGRDQRRWTAAQGRALDLGASGGAGHEADTLAVGRPEWIECSVRSDDLHRIQLVSRPYVQPAGLTDVHELGAVRRDGHRG